MDIAPTDIALFFVSIVTCTYCFILNRKLKAIRDSRSGLASTIEDLSGSIASLHKTTERTSAEAKFLANLLGTEISRANEANAKLAKTTTETEARHARMISDLHDSYRQLSASLRGVVEESQVSISELNELIGRLSLPESRNGPKPEGTAKEDGQADQNYALEDLF